ncbi:STAS-like domain-containing protein [Pseudomonas nitroreducens]|uniref:STAS-like domain-containing protein n=1 Tax=Pseudomonas nitroreducens TaxID=46680 RepID=UPI0014799273|nr:STAS-like domain-containing protein [Pseudomonas nitroreducens]NNN28295.1 STAS-like domain-containing protein [Pseudomonas nitroreducens]
MITIYVKDFSEFPGPRKESVGPNSGEKFRDTVLLKALREHPDEEISVNLDGTAGYGSSFLEESFGGLIRAGVPYQRVIGLCENLVSEEDKSLIEEIREYITEAHQEQG